MTANGKTSAFSGNGVFSTENQSKDSPDASKKLYWLVETGEEGMSIRSLDESRWLPVGEGRTISMEELLEGGYLPEPELYADTVYPRLQEAIRLPSPDNMPKADLGVTMPQGEPLLDSLRQQFNGALNMAVKGQTEKAETELGKILKQGDLNRKEHRHLFNEFGISLRKNSLQAQSMDFYNRALELTGDGVDENLHFNMARALFDEERYQPCVQHLLKALKACPKNWAVLHFLSWMRQRKLIPKQYALDVDELLAEGVPAIPLEVLKKVTSEGLSENMDTPSHTVQEEKKKVIWQGEGTAPHDEESKATPDNGNLPGSMDDLLKQA